MKPQVISVKISGEMKDRIIKDFQLLLSLVPDWVDNVKKGLDPTFYGTGTYEGDLTLKKRVDDIREFIKGYNEKI
jgi:hypothetical protein